MAPKTPANTSALNQLIIDKKIQEYRDRDTLSHFYDLFADLVTDEAITKEIVSKSDTYFGDKKKARNALLRAIFDEQNLFTSTRDIYVKITSEKILHFFRISVFAWSKGGKSFAESGSLDTFSAMPMSYFRELYDETIQEIETLSEVIDQILTKMQDEMTSFKAVTMCHTFYTKRPLFGKNVPVYHGSLNYITALAKIASENAGNEGYFQTAGMRIRQFRDMFDPEKNISEDFRSFVAASDKSTTQIRHDVEETLVQYVKTFLSFSDLQKKQKKDEVKASLDGFLSETGYTLATLGYDISAIYKHTLDMLLMKKSGWELKYVKKGG